MIWLIVGVVLGTLGFLYFSRRSAQKKPETLMKRLIRLTHDSDVAQRLVDRERERSPHLSHAKLIARVIRRLERDRRR
ncbi:MAG: hypothetical protein AB7S26_18080 [Sandaracinaceae bacterium]